MHTTVTLRRGDFTSPRNTLFADGVFLSNAHIAVSGNTFPQNAPKKLELTPGKFHIGPGALKFSVSTLNSPADAMLTNTSPTYRQPFDKFSALA